MKSEEIRSLWARYHQVLSLYRDVPLPKFIEMPALQWDVCKEKREEINRERAEVRKKNEETEQIVYIVRNEKGIEKRIKYLEDSFEFSREEVEENISFYDVLFELSLYEIFDKVTFFIELFGSKETFLTAMRVGAPERATKYVYKHEMGFWGIMSYVRKSCFVEKIRCLCDTLCIDQESAAKVFVSYASTMYRSAQTTNKIINEICEILSINGKQFGEMLKKCPDLHLDCGRIRDLAGSMARYFSITRAEAVSVILRYPHIVNDPFAFFIELAFESLQQIPEKISEKPWLYQFGKMCDSIIVSRYEGYGYGYRHSLAEFLKQVEERFGRIVNIVCRQEHPMVRENTRNIKEVPYTVLVVRTEKGKYRFVTLGSGFATCNRYGWTAEDRLLANIFNSDTRCFAEFVVDAPQPGSREYDLWLTYVFFMSATGSTVPCVCQLKNGKAIVTEEPEEQIAEPISLGAVSCVFKTINVIPIEAVEEYKSKYTPEKKDQDRDDWDEMGDEDVISLDEFFEGDYDDELFDEN